MPAPSDKAVFAPTKSCKNGFIGRYREGIFISKKIEWFKSLKQLFQPKEGSYRWLKELSKEAIMAYRDKLWERLFDPNEDINFRWQIRDKIFPYIDKILRNRDE